MRTGRPPIALDKIYIVKRSKKMSNGCWDWLGSVRPDGYGKITSSGKQYLAHRLAYCIWRGMAMESEKLVLHKCNNKRCCNPSHLYAGTQAENVNDAIRAGVKFGSWNIGRYNGMGNPNAKLTPRAIEGIKAAIKKGLSLKQIRNKFGISNTPIYKIKNGTHWSSNVIK